MNTDPLFDVDGQNVLVSGASRGIGFALAKAFAERGARVVITGRDAATLDEATSKIDGKVFPLVCDVADTGEIESVVGSTIETLGHVDTFVNCAGVNRRKAALEVSEEDYDFVMDINMKGAFFMAKAVGRHMVERKSGNQIGIASLNTDRPGLQLSPYAVSKAGIGSLTKVLATTVMAMILVDEGFLDLDKPVQDFLPLFQGPGKEKVTVRNLLTHSSGLVAYGDLYNEIKGKQAYLERIQALDLDYEPGSQSVYSDYGMILLGEILERVAGQPMDEFLEERVYGPLGMKETGFLPPADLRDRIAPTEDDPWRGYMIRGEVHDENAHALGGVAPHAGVFGTAPDLARFLQMILNGGVFEHQRIISRDIVEEWTKKAGIPDSDRATGWDTKSPEKSSAGTYFSPDSYGHLGYTGTSMWVDPERQLFVILLTNRVHPTRENNLIRQVRPAVADAVVQALETP